MGEDTLGEDGEMEGTDAETGEKLPDMMDIIGDLPGGDEAV